MTPPGSRRPVAGLRPFLPKDVPALAELIAASILELTGEEYDEDQQEAWAAAAVDDEAAFGARLAGALTLVAEREGEPVGVIALAENAVIDLLYVRPDCAGQGIGAMLLDAVERLAQARGAKTLTADASDTALNFFQTHGYTAQRRNTVPRGAVWLGNTTVQKSIEGPPPTAH